jgi:hypothetical protein
MNQKNIKIMTWGLIVIVLINLILFAVLRNGWIFWGVIAIAYFIAFPGMKYLKNKQKTSKITKKIIREKIK